MNSKHLSVRTFLCAASMSALALGVASPAFAQQAAPADDQAAEREPALALEPVLDVRGV